MTSNAATSNSAERFRLAISDGKHWCTAMLATQLNEIVKSDQIHNNTILRLDEYLSNAVQGKKWVPLAAGSCVVPVPAATSCMQRFSLDSLDVSCSS